ncbi:MAG: S-methyl-5'-thioadenosine phosphorylase [Nitrolancea sp.]
MERRPRLAVIGGSGLYDMPGLTNLEYTDIDTPFGSPSDRIAIGEISGYDVAFLPRHGQHHRLSPTHVPYRANVWALKSIGVERLLSVSAVGSMRDDVHPLEMLVPDQIFDRTTSRGRTFFDDVVVHVSIADPFCEHARQTVTAAVNETGVRVHDGGTYICIEGPQFSTKAESRIFRSWGVDVIGMTAMPEARLAREAGLCYVTLAMVTDYDVWHEVEEAVSVQAVIDNLRRNVAHAQSVVRSAVPGLHADWTCGCGSSLQGAIATAPEGISAETRSRLSLFLGNSEV